MLKNNHKQSSSAQAVLRYCLLFLAVFFFSSGSSIVFADSAKSTDDISIDASRVISDDFYFSTDFSSTNPFQPDSAPGEEPESSGDVEQENSDDDNKVSFWIHSPGYAFSVSACVNNHFYRLTKAYQNQATLPLYILFHSWKSYLL